MLTKKEKILIQPFVEENYKKHRRKIQSARPAIDFSRPPEQPHVLIKLKKIQKERERMQEIERENQRLLQKLGHIMSTNRIENYWKQPHPTFLCRVYIKTPQPKRRSTSVPAKRSTIESETTSTPIVKSRSCARCPTCSGKPIISSTKIPEERIPFAPPRTSWNQKILNDKSQIQRCKLCCCTKIV